eukprot:gnl/Chilomastix_caulleri/8056.p1 GENE.gnl/Chilomastix_caulleri/8056~~gnl/Chilomastix_caulleri/8056.p1  ORF type:complete len:60 (+),score=7.37 gnl/Chilomastix_caulleri/8056:75-254(+)
MESFPQFGPCMQCPIHGKEAVSYCLECNRLICRDCHDCREHETQTLEEVVRRKEQSWGF